MSTKPTSKIQWHQIFAAFLQELLEPVGVKVNFDVPISPQPPEMDIILMQQTDSLVWTEEQKRYLPDGLRDSLANHAPLELKYTEVVDGAAIRQILMYDIAYHRSHERDAVTIQSFLVSAKTPHKETLAEYGYHATEQAGVYRSHNIFVQEIPLLVLNELSNEPHNVFFKLFASRKTAKQAAVKGLRTWWMTQLSISLYLFIDGLLKLWLKGETIVKKTITAESIREEGRRSLIASLLPLLRNKELADFWTEMIPEFQEARAQGELKGRLEGELKGRVEGELKGRVEGELKGRVEGELKGRVEARAEAEAKMWRLAFKNIRQTLAIRFGTSLEQFDKRLQPLDLPTLERLNELAFTVENLAEFEAALPPLPEIN